MPKSRFVRFRLSPLQNSAYFALILTTALALPRDVFAGGCSYRNGVDARSRAAGGAGAVWGRGALAGIAENPAALSAVPNPNLALNLSSASTVGQFANAASSSGLLGQGPFLVPEGAYAHPLGESGWTVGGGVTPAMMLAGGWEYADPVGAGGASYGVQRHNSEFLLLRTAGGASYRVSERLSVGGNVGVVYNRNSLQMPYIFQEEPTLSGLKTLLDLRTTGYAPDACAGVLFDVASNVHVGGVYKTGLSFESRGRATGDAGAQFAALGVGAPATFAYDAEVHTSAPRVATAGLAWEPAERVSLVFQGEWHGWKAAMPELPIFLTNGTNATINTLLASTSLNDRAPFRWNDRWVSRVGGEVAVSRRWLLRGGYAHSNRLVPDATLSPVTADITENTVTMGAGYSGAFGSIDFAYQWDLRQNRTVPQSALAGGEYSQTRMGVGLHWLTVSTSLHFGREN